MRPADELVLEYLSERSAVFFLRQCLVIMLIFIFGAIICDLIIKGEVMWIRRCLLAFPVGLSAFVVTAYAMLVAGIPYTAVSVTSAVLLITALALFKNRRSYSPSLIRQSRVHMLIALAAAASVSVIAVSGLAPISVSNDTMYYFRRYPDAIVYYRGLRDQFDFFLTDTGLGVVCIDTLPALFGFGESFGIREMMHIDFVAFFGICVYERASLSITRKSSAAAAALIITALLAVSTPFYILGHWALANMYFMEMFFMAAYTLTGEGHEEFYAGALITVAFSLFRIEGALFVVWLAVCTATFSGLFKKTAVCILLPLTLLFGCYCFKIYTAFSILDNNYTFLTPQKAVLLVGLIAGAGIALYFILPSLSARLGRRLVYLYILLMAAGNLLMLIRDRELYIGNLRAFYANLFRQSGWGMFPYLVITSVLLLLAEWLITRKMRPVRLSGPDHFNITLVVGFLLITLAASYGRGDVLSEEVGDSGNRVLLQVVPLIVMTLASLYMTTFGSDTEDPVI